VADQVTVRGAERPIRWLLRSAGEPKIEDEWIRMVEGDTEILGESLLPAGSSLKKCTNRGIYITFALNEGIASTLLILHG